MLNTDDLKFSGQGTQLSQLIAAKSTDAYMHISSSVASFNHMD